MENIFTNLAKYKPQPEITPLENFFTQSLKFVLDLDAGLLNKFVNAIAGEIVFKPPFVLDSQMKYGNSIIDLQITDKNYKKIFIEIKVNAHENRYYDDEAKEDFGQVEKYLQLKKGYVCFIARDRVNIRVKRHKDKFLGQFEWFEVYKLLNEYLRHNKIDKTKKYFITKFLDFMKEQNMQPFQKFNKKDIALSKTNFLDFHDKLLDFLKEVCRDKRIREFCKKYKLKPIFDSPKFSHRNNSFLLELGKAEWGGHKEIILGFELYKKGESEKFSEGLFYYQGVYTNPVSIYDKFREAIKRKNIKKEYFVKGADMYWPLMKEFEFAKFIKSGEKKAITYIYNSLLELERKGVMDVLKKLR